MVWASSCFLSNSVRVDVDACAFCAAAVKLSIVSYSWYRSNLILFRGVKLKEINFVTLMGFGQLAE